MTTPAVISAFQTLHASLTGVKSAPTAMPTHLNSVALPFAFTWPGPSVESGGWRPGPGWYEVRRYYIVRCYVKPLVQGLGVDEGYQEALTLFQRFGEAYVATANQNLSGAVAHIGPSIRDTGVRGDLEWVRSPETPVYYHGFEFRVEVSEKVAL